MAEIKTVAVIGAGIMGRGIAHAAALGGYRTILEDLLPNALRRAENEIRGNLDKAVEIDGYADRQDLRYSLLKIANEEGARISLGTDAHHPWQLAYIELSLAAVILAKIPPVRIINFMTLPQLTNWIGDLRSKKIR